MRHYFLNTEHTEKDFFVFEETFLQKKYRIKSCSDVFSKQKIDDGTKVLLQTVVQQVQLSGNVLDFGCGYGIVGMVLKHHFADIKLTMLDVNKTAVSLSKQNITQNGFNESDFTVLESNLLESVKTKQFDHVVTNPPIKVGKPVLFEAITQICNHLTVGGTLTLVIRKDHGMNSLKEHITNLLGNCQVLNRQKGYYILHAKKIG